MKKIRKFLAFSLAMAITISLLAAVPLTAGAALSSAPGTCTVGGIAKSFDQALIDVPNKGTIKLYDNIARTEGIIIDGKSFTIDMNGKSMTIENGSNKYGVYINSRTLTIKGSGALTIIGEKAGIYAENDGVFSLTGKAKVNVTGTDGPGIEVDDSKAKVYATGAWGTLNRKVEIKGNANGTSVNRSITLSSPYNGYFWDEFVHRNTRSRVYLRGSSNPESRSVSSTEWRLRDGQWFYYKNDSPVKGWAMYNGSWYYMDSKGLMQTGWIMHNGTWYFLNASGAMATGWLRYGNCYYFLKPGSGAMATGWLLDGNKWYYLMPDGAMVVNRTMTIGGKAYQFNSQGVCTNP